MIAVSHNDCACLEPGYSFSQIDVVLIGECVQVIPANAHPRRIAVHATAGAISYLSEQFAKVYGLPLASRELCFPQVQVGCGRTDPARVRAAVRSPPDARHSTLMLCSPLALATNPAHRPERPRLVQAVANGFDFAIHLRKADFIGVR